MYLIWHLRHQAEPLHLWLRAHIEAVAAALSTAQPDRPGPTPAN
jgi:hypothetical protein